MLQNNFFDENLMKFVGYSRTLHFSILNLLIDFRNKYIFGKGIAFLKNVKLAEFCKEIIRFFFSKFRNFQTFLFHCFTQALNTIFAKLILLNKI